MGGSVSISDSSQLFAFSVIKDEFERLNEIISRDGIEFEDSDLHALLSKVYDIAVTKYNSSFRDCSSASILAMKYKMLSNDERATFENEMMDAIGAKEKKLKLLNDSAQKAKGNYDKSTGGTAEDTKNEAEAAKILRGETGSTENDDAPILRFNKDIYLHPIQEKTLALVPVWRKFLSLSSGCYMYIHLISREIVSIRPNEFVDAVLTNDIDTNVVIDPRISNPSNGLPVCTLSTLQETIDALVAAEKTPLFLETSPDQFLAAYFTYKAILLDASVLVIPFAKGGVKREVLIEEGRAKLVLAMKTGVPFVLYLGQTTIEHADWKTKLCKKDIFPTDIFQQAGLKLQGPAHAPRYKALFKPNELEHGQAILKEGFRVIVLSSLSPYDYEEKLKDSIPLGYMSAYYIQRDI